MKKKIMLCLLTVCLLALAATACGGGSHNHTLSMTEQKAATCIEVGYEAYYVCDDCGEMFSESAGKNKIDAPISIPLAPHTPTAVEACPASCTENGNIAYWLCTVCNKMFSDAECTDEITDVNVYAAGHDMQRFTVKNPTTTEDGYLEHYVCKSCGLYYLDEFGAIPTDEDSIKIAAVKENIDGVLTDSFYGKTDNRLGGSNLNDGGTGMITNARIAEDGVYFHIKLNHNYYGASAANSYLRVYFTANNADSLLYEGRHSTTKTQPDVMLDILVGNGEYGSISDRPYSVRYFNRTENPESSLTAATTVIEQFVSYGQLATLNSGALADSFDETDGVYSLKYDYNMFISVNAGFYKDDNSMVDEFTNHGEARCGHQDGGEWRLWYTNGYGDWGASQNWFVLTEDGFERTIPRYENTLTVSAANHANGTVNVPATVQYGETLSGSITPDSGFVVTGVIVQGELFSLNSALEEGVIEFSAIDTSALGLKWNQNTIKVEAVIVRKEYQTITFTAKQYKDGATALLPQGTTVTITTSFGEKYDGIVGSDGNVTVENVLCAKYTAIADGHLGSEPFAVEKDKAVYGDVVMPFVYAEFTGNHGNADLSKMNDANHVITLNGETVDGTADYAEAKLNLSAEIAQSKYATVSFTVSLEEIGQVWARRFGVKMTATNGIATFISDPGNAGLQIYGMTNPNDIFEGWNNKYNSLYDSALAAVTGAGLQMRVVRNDTQITQQAYLGGNWVPFGDPVTCDTNAATDIRLLVCAGKWEFGNISYEALEYVAATAPTTERTGNIAYLKGATNLYNVDGSVTTLEAVTLPVLQDFENVTIEVTGRKDGNITALANGEITFSNEILQYRVVGNIVDGSVTLERLIRGELTVTAGDYFGTVIVEGDSAPASLQLEYSYAEFTGNHGNADLSKMNDANHVITLNGETVDGTADYAEAKLNLSAEVAQSKYATVSFTVSLKDIEQVWARRFGVKMTATNGIATFISDPGNAGLQIYGMTNQDNIFDGWNNTYNSLYDSALAAVTGAGLQMRVVRNDTQITQQAYLDGNWVQFGDTVTCDTNAVTDIRLLVCAGKWEFSNITFTASAA